MSANVDLRFDNPNSCSFNAAEISVANSRVQLIKSSQAFTWNEDFADDTDFTYDNTKAEFVGGEVRQKAQTISNSTFYNNFDSKDGVWGDGALTGTLAGSATVSGGVLNLPITSSSYISYDGANVPTGETGCIRFTFTPNYSGTPASTVYLFSSSVAIDNAVSLLQMRHSGTEIRIQILNSVGGAVLDSQTGNTFNPTAGVSYEFELNWDATAGVHRLFIDGVETGPAKAGTGTLGTRGIMRLGTASSSASVPSANGTIDDFLIFSTVQHTAGYTPAPIVLSYLESVVELPDVVSVNPVSAFSSLTADLTNVARFILNGYYWTGAVWSVSDDSFAQTSLVADINSNLATHPAISATMSVKTVFQDNSGSRDAVSEVVMGYTALSYPAYSKVTHLMVASMDTLTTFSENTPTVPAGTSVTYILEINGAKYWYSGAAWVVSDGTDIESNTSAEVQTNAGTLPIDNGAQVRVCAVLSTNSTFDETPELFIVSLVYDINLRSISTPALTNITGALVDLGGIFIGVSDAILSLETTHVQGDPFFSDDVTVLPINASVATVTNGEISLFVVPSGARKYKFSVQYGISGTPQTIILGYAQVPSQPTVALDELTFTELA